MDGDTEAAAEAAGLAGQLAALLAGKFGELTADTLRQTFSGWRVFERDGRWWAMRGGEVRGEGPRSLIRPVVGAGSLEGLADQLSLQEWLRRMTTDELETVWREGFAALAELAR